NLAANAKLNFLRETDNDRLEFYGRGDYAQQKNQNTDRDETTVQKATGGVNYDYVIYDPGLLGVFTRFDHDFFQDLVLRSQFGGGPGYRFIKREDMELLGRIGVAYVHEDYRSSSPTPDRSFVAGFASERYRWTISETQRLLQGLDVTPNL